MSWRDEHVQSFWGLYHPSNHLNGCHGSGTWGVDGLFWQSWSVCSFWQLFLSDWRGSVSIASRQKEKPPQASFNSPPPSALPHLDPSKFKQRSGLFPFSCGPCVRPHGTFINPRVAPSCVNTAPRRIPNVPSWDQSARSNSCRLFRGLELREQAAAGIFPPRRRPQGFLNGKIKNRGQETSKLGLSVAQTFLRST